MRHPSRKPRPERAGGGLPRILTGFERTMSIWWTILAGVVMGVGSFAPFRNAMNRSGAGGIEVSPTSSLQLPTARITASVPTPNI